MRRVGYRAPRPHNRVVRSRSDDNYTRAASRAEPSSPAAKHNPFSGIAPPLPPDVETSAFARARRQLRGFPWLLQLASLLSALAFARIVSDPSWDVSPRNFIITASIAACFWIAFVVTLWRMRARILIVPGK